MTRTTAFALTSVAGLLLWASNLTAQVTTATLHATVTDPSGSVILGARVVLTEERTGIARTQQTNGLGMSVFPFVPIGVYTIEVNAEGFRSIRTTGLALDAAQSVSMRFELQIGDVVEKLDVAASAPLVNTVSAEQLEVMKSHQVEELPVAARRASDLFVVGTAIQRSLSTNNGNTAGSFKMNGLGAGAMNLTMDGIPASGHPATPQAGLRGGFNYIEVVSLEAIAEMHVAKGAFSAEFAHAMSGNINVVTKSGTNDWHGSMFSLFNTEELNAREYYLANKPASTFNQFGGSLGGPILKNKLFAFGTYEGYRDRRFTVQQGDVWTAQFREKMLANFPQYKLSLDEIYLPNQPHAPDAVTGRHITAASLSGNTDQYLVKPDLWLTSNVKLSATWQRDRPDNRQPLSWMSPGPNAFRSFRGKVDRLNVTFTSFGSNWSAETRFGRNHVDNDRADEMFLNGEDPNQAESAFGQRRKGGIFALGTAQGGETNFVGNRPHYIVEQKVTLLKGRHSLKFGGLLNRAGFGGANVETPGMLYFTPEAVLANTPQLAVFTFGTQPWKGTTYNTGFFLQDDWKIAPRLTLNLGLRYDYFRAMIVTGIDGGPSPGLYNAPFVDLASFTLGEFRLLKNPYDNDVINFGPRFGFAYNPDGHEKTVLRGGVGVMFTPPNVSVLELSALNSLEAPFRVSLNAAELATLGVRYNTYHEDIYPFVSGRSGVVSHDLLDDKFQAPYAMNYTFGIQRALSDTAVFETAFVGNAGRKFVLQRVYNQPDPVTGIRPNPRLGQARYWDNSDSTHYVSWQSSLRKRLGSNITGSVHYTWGKAISYGDGDLTYGVGRSAQEFFDVASNRGRAAEDLAHRLIGNFVYNLPALEAAPHRLVREILGGWQASGIFSVQSGLPLTVTQPSSRDSSRPDLINPDTVILDEGLQYLSRAAFAPVPLHQNTGFTVRPGTAGRNMVDGPGRWNFDLSLGKNLKFTERIRLQLRADMLNAFNHVDLTDINTQLNSASFGQRVGSTAPRRIQIHMRLAF